MTPPYDTNSLYGPTRDTPRLTDPHPAATRGSEATRGSTADLFVLAANRLGYGPGNGQRSEWNSLGADDNARYAAYLAQQLDPGSITDTTYSNQRAAGGFQSLNLSQNMQWRNFIEGGGDSDRPQQEAEMDWFLRAIHSKRQLETVMTDFWVDHFNVYSREWPTYGTWPSWIDGLQSRAFGNFRDLLGFVSEHPAMLYYLDQYTSEFPRPNENYLRENFELHTMGAEHYLGAAVKQIDVPTWHSVHGFDLIPGGSDSPGNRAGALSSHFGHPNGIPLGYVDDDVFAAARAFVGYTFDFGEDNTDPDAGLFYFDEGRHDLFQHMSVLNFGNINIDGGVLAADRGPKILDMLAFHPGTAMHLCQKLVRRFVSDDPPQSLVESAALIFMAERASSDQLKQVVQHILESNEFKSSFGMKLKRPFEVVVSMVRATNASFQFQWDGDRTGDFLSRFDRTGNRSFRWSSPDGYPDVREKWETAAPRVMTWRMGQWMCSIRKLSGQWFLDVDAKTPGSVARTPEGMATYWINRIFQRTMPTDFVNEVIDYLAQGYAPHLPLNIDPSETTEDEERLQMMIALLMSTPEFCEK